MEHEGTLFEVGQVTHASARISDDGRYRYTLGRTWDPDLPVLTFIMLNPSTADALLDDPTIRRCVGFAKVLDRGGIRVVNLYAYRATQPDELAAVDDPIGPENDEVLRTALADAAEYGPGTHVIAAWGGWTPRQQYLDPAHSKTARAEFVAMLARTRGVVLHALHVTAGGHPGHPLYLPATSRPVPWQPKEEHPA